MAISYIGSATGTDTATPPTHQAGDLLLVFAFRDGSTSAPSLPTGMTSINNGGANSCSARLGYVVAQAAGTSIGTWTNATSVIVHVYRGVGPQNPIGVNYRSTGSSTTLSYSLNAQALTITNGTSWVVGFGGTVNTNGNITVAPSGMTNRSSVSDATDEAAGFDTTSGVSSWTAADASVGGTSGGWVTICVEIRETVNNSGISYVGGQTASATTLTVPTHQTGDLILFYAYRDGSLTPPTVPSGYTSITSVTRNSAYGNQSMVAGYKIAASSSETSGTWTNASILLCQVYRPNTANTTINIGATATGNNAPLSNTATLTALTCTNTGLGSWVTAAFARGSYD